MDKLSGKRRGLQLNTEHAIPPFSTVTYGGQMDKLSGKRWGLDLSTEHSIPPFSTVTYGGQMDELSGKRRGCLANVPSSKFNKVGCNCHRSQVGKEDDYSEH